MATFRVEINPVINAARKLNGYEECDCSMNQALLCWSAFLVQTQETRLLLDWKYSSDLSMIFIKYFNL